MEWVLATLVIIIVAYLGVRRLPGERPANERWGPTVDDPMYQALFNREEIDGTREPDIIEHQARNPEGASPQEW